MAFPVWRSAVAVPHFGMRPTLRFALVLLATVVVPAAAQTTVDLRLKEGTNIAAASSPDGKTIAFDLLGRIWTLPRAGGAATVITDIISEARQPVWTPDGQRIAFQSYRDGTWHIYSVAKDGTDLRQHTSGPFDDREPDFVNNRTLVFSSDRSGNYDIYRLDLVTGVLEQLTTDAGDDFSPAVHRPSGAIAWASTRAGGTGLWYRAVDGSVEKWAAAAGQLAGPSWSPAGDKLSYTSFVEGASRLMVVERNGTPIAVSPATSDVFPFRATWFSDTTLLHTANGRIEWITLGGAAIGTIPFDARVTFTRSAYVRRPRDFEGTKAAKVFGLVAPSVSPDGQSVAFVALGDLYVARDGKVEQLTKDPTMEMDPVWSPDGASLVYVSDRTGTMELVVRTMATGAERALTKNAGGAAMPAFTPDGGSVVFQVQRGLGTEIQAVDVATGAIRTVRAGLFGPSRATFSRDGRVMAVTALHANSARFREGRNEILLVSLEGGADRWVVPPGGRGITTRGMDGPAWAPNGRRMAYIQDGLLWSVPVGVSGDPVGPPIRLTDELANAPSWSSDSRTIVYQATDGLRRLDVIDGRVEKIDVPLTWARTHPARRVTVHAGRLWDGQADKVIADVDVLVRGHRIEKIVPHAAQYHRDSVVDASGLTVMPGLADAHAHIGFGAGEALGRSWLAFGITTIRDPASEPFQMRERREAVESGVRVGPRELATGRIFDGERIYYNFNNAMTPGAQLRQELERAGALDFSLIKTYVRLPDALQARIIADAHAMGIPVSSHELYPAVAFGVDHTEHITGTSRRGYSPKASRLFRSYEDVSELLAKSGMSITPTMALQGGFAIAAARTPAILDDPRVTLVYGKEYAAGLKATLRNPAFGSTPAMMASQGKLITGLVRAGARVMAGTDSPIIPYGLALHVELENYVEYGLTPVEALRTATTGFARIVGLEKDLGVLSAGRLADLVAVEGNPLEKITDTRRVKVVLKDGEVYTYERLLSGAVRPAAPKKAAAR